MRTPAPPAPDLRFWVLISLASVAGADLGDFCSHVLRLGHMAGIPVFAASFAALMLAAGAGRGLDAVYWAAIVVVRAAATNLADLATHDLAVPDLVFAAAMLAVLAGLVAFAWRDRRIPPAGPWYWVAMLLAGVGGTALGDGCADRIGLGASGLVWMALWLPAVGVALWRSARGPVFPWPYWAVVVVVRTFGTNAGDWMAGRHGLALGLPLSTGLSLGALSLASLAWRRPRCYGPA